MTQNRIRRIWRSNRAHLLLTIAVSLLSALITYVRLLNGNIVAADFTWAWRGARLLVEGSDPYELIRPEGAYPYNDYLYYPLPALLVALPLIPFAGPFAGAIFVGISSVLLCWGLLKEQRKHSLLLFLSAPYVYALISVQWSPLITAAAFVPVLGFCIPAKPNLGIAILIAYPHPRRIALAALSVLISLIIMPTWPLALFRSLPAHLNYVPLFNWFGLPVMLAALFWRRSAARLLVVMACVPQRLIYDQLALFLIPQTLRQMVMMIIGGWLGIFLGLIFDDGIWALSCVYLPALACILIQERASIARHVEVWREDARRMRW